MIRRGNVRDPRVDHLRGIKVVAPAAPVAHWRAEKALRLTLGKEVPALPICSLRRLLDGHLVNYLGWTLYIMEVGEVGRRGRETASLL